MLRFVVRPDGEKASVVLGRRWDGPGPKPGVVYEIICVDDNPANWVIKEKGSAVSSLQDEANMNGGNSVFPQSFAPWSRSIEEIVEEGDGAYILTLREWQMRWLYKNLSGLPQEEWDSVLKENKAPQEVFNLLDDKKLVASILKSSL